MNLTVVLAHLSLMEADASSYGLEVPRDAASIDAMRLGESRGDARVLRQIAAGVLNRQAGCALRTRSSNVQRTMSMKASALNE